MGELYADGNKPELGDTVECVKEETCSGKTGIHFTNGQRYVVNQLRSYDDNINDQGDYVGFEQTNAASNSYGWERYRFILVRRKTNLRQRIADILKKDTMSPEVEEYLEALK